jgi:hypothetical protein
MLVRPMMYGFGDDPVPRTDTTELLEEMVIEYLTDIVYYWHYILFP